jgi:hypothetical protein
MGKKMTKAGAEMRRAIRADVDANPGIDHKQLRSKYTAGEPLVESALTKTVAEWDAVIAVTTNDVPKAPAVISRHPEPSPTTSLFRPTTQVVMPGIEQGVVKFSRKPAKMGTDYIFWVPRVYLKNGLVDQTCEYEGYLKRVTR